MEYFPAKISLLDATRTSWKTVVSTPKQKNENTFLGLSSGRLFMLTCGNVRHKSTGSELSCCVSLYQKKTYCNNLKANSRLNCSVAKRPIYRAANFSYPMHLGGKECQGRTPYRVSMVLSVNEFSNGASREFQANWIPNGRCSPLPATRITVTNHFRLVCPRTFHVFSEDQPNERSARPSAQREKN